MNNISQTKSTNDLADEIFQAQATAFNEFLCRAVAINEPHDCLVWLVDFDFKVATSGSLSMLTCRQWQDFKRPTSEKFKEFLNAQKSESEEEIERTEESFDQNLRPNNLRQQTASEQLAALILADATIAAKHSYSPDTWLISTERLIHKAVQLADLLFEELIEN